jgi:hypothetical protein
MTNTQKITVNQTIDSRGHPVMHGWTEQNQVVIRARIRDRELEAASERLAATAHATHPIGVRRTVGRMLISAGRRIAGEPAVAGSPASRPARPMAG